MMYQSITSGRRHFSARSLLTDLGLFYLDDLDLFAPLRRLMQIPPKNGSTPAEHFANCLGKRDVAECTTRKPFMELIIRRVTDNIYFSLLLLLLLLFKSSTTVRISRAIEANAVSESFQDLIGLFSRGSG